mmetsp:Transcript_71491/g.209542  ORF Transcript_71491/g.209542 Transcript_71491/m.209542 type:complete len:203 (-) Transcript_71491:167-775(-)
MCSGLLRCVVDAADVVALVRGADGRCQPARRARLHGQPSFGQCPEAGAVRQVQQDQHARAQVHHVDVRQHLLEEGGVLARAGPMGHILWHARHVHPDELEELALGRVEEVLQRLELLATWVGRVHRHPTVRDCQYIPAVAASDDVVVVERDLLKRRMVLGAHLLIKRHLAATIAADEVCLHKRKHAALWALSLALNVSAHRQ